jgi:hypothetical protein
LLFAANYTFFVYVGAPWTLAFSSGVLFETFPSAALLGLYCIAILCAMPSRHNDDTANPFGPAGFVAFALGLLIAVIATLMLAVSFAGMRPAILQPAYMLRGIGPVVPYAMLAFAAVLTWIAWRYRNAPAESAGPPALPRETVKPAGPPIKWLLLMALVLTLIACIFSFGDDVSMMIPLVLVVNLHSMVLPTFAIYFLLLLGIWLTAVRRTPGSAAVLVLALLPFLHWGYSHWVAANDHRREAVEIAAVQTRAAPRIPSTMVFESEHVSGLHGAWKVPAIDRVIAKGAYGSKLIEIDRNPPRGGAAKQRAEVTLPDEYLLLKVGRSSGFAKKGQNYSPSGGPLELRYVSSSRDDLVAVWYRTFNPGPTILPVLMTSGWYRGSNGVPSGEISQSVGRFLTASLKTPG